MKESREAGLTREGNKSDTDAEKLILNTDHVSESSKQNEITERSANTRVDTDQLPMVLYTNKPTSAMCEPPVINNNMEVCEIDSYGRGRCADSEPLAANGLKADS